jgi:glutamate-5-semialdehyde dehydrogenase
LRTLFGMATTTESVTEVCRRARAASLILPGIASSDKDAALAALARLLRERTAAILDANRVDLDAGREAGLDDALIDRLRLDPERIEAMAVGVEAVRALDDPIGELLERRTLESGIEMEHRRVPIGVVAIVYEARPNVTIDAAALCLKSGNAAVLRGSSSAGASNAVLVEIVKEAVAEASLPEGSVEAVAGGGREELGEQARQRDLVDLIIPRGGEGLKAALEAVAEVPILYAASGNCHVYVDAAADLEMARSIAYNAKVQRPGVCNAAETLLVHESVAPEFLPAALGDLAGAGVELVGDERARELSGGVTVAAATGEDWDREYHGLKLVVGVVDSVSEAVDHVNRHGSGHSEAIVTGDEAAADAFTGGVDAACVYVNASTRFTDGFEFGMGAEIGNSTQKLHARGPIGLRELTSTKYVLRGTGQTRG